MNVSFEVALINPRSFVCMSFVRHNLLKKAQKKLSKKEITLLPQLVTLLDRFISSLLSNIFQ